MFIYFDIKIFCIKIMCYDFVTKLYSKFKHFYKACFA